MSVEPISGEPLRAAEALDIRPDRPAGCAGVESEAVWTLRGVTSYERYVRLAERTELEAIQQPLGRPSSTVAVLIPIRKTDEWWALAPDERRAIFEESSHHIHLGLQALPTVARHLYHSRELGEPFDFLTWFEFAPTGTAVFDELLTELRKSQEWRYVEREVEVRLRRRTGG